MSKRLYVAYGSNLNIQQMASRCPGAKLYTLGQYIPPICKGSPA